ncbi:hypothetical protein [Nocardioides panacisoli]|uniref:Uncharacterized protein n=1 Tax=Nocardioides panacisoli TaxID=627624 RepID=A0ABP7HS47_9ACTN
MDERVPAERPLDDATRARLRAELLEAVARDDPGSSSRSWRWLAPAGVAAAVAAGVLAGAVLLGGGNERSDELGPAGGSSVVQEASDTPSSTPTSLSADPDGCLPDSVGNARRQLRDQMQSYRKLLPTVQAYRDIVAQHLDPAGEHLDPRATNVQSSGAACGMSGLGTKVGWSVPGQDGLGEVQVEVTTSWRNAQVHLAHDGWMPAVDVPGATKAWSVKYDGGFAVAVQRTDGLTVALSADELFGNNSLTGIAGFPFSPDDLFETAADPAFTLP